MNTIYVLPEVDESNKNANKMYAHRCEVASMTDYRPLTVEEFMAIDYSDAKLLMILNVDFFNHCVKLCEKKIVAYVDFIKVCAADDYDTENILCLDDLLNCGFYGDDYESSRCEFANNFVEDRYDF